MPASGCWLTGRIAAQCPCSLGRALTSLQTFDDSSDKEGIKHLNVGDEGIETTDLVPAKRADRG